MRKAAKTQPETRDRILAEAERVFRAYGYAKTTVADIAKACGMSPANVYRFFESTAAINEAITAVILKRQEDVALGIAAERRTAAHRLKKLILDRPTDGFRHHLRRQALFAVYAHRLFRHLRAELLHALRKRH